MAKEITEWIRLWLQEVALEVKKQLINSSLKMKLPADMQHAVAGEAMQTERKITANFSQPRFAIVPKRVLYRYITWNINMQVENMQACKLD